MMSKCVSSSQFTLVFLFPLPMTINWAIELPFICHVILLNERVMNLNPVKEGKTALHDTDQ